jgi:copper chaperone CopZ
MKDRKSQGKCPQCGEKGKPVKPVTLRSLLCDDLRDLVKDPDQRDWRFCATPDCPVVYFEDSGHPVFEKHALTVRVGIKETQAPRPVCYCFGHTVEEIEEEVARTGKTTVLDDIRTRMKEACWCETTSPMGSCCLGTVTRFVKAAHAASETETHAPSGEAEDCCAVHQTGDAQHATSSPAGRRLGTLATGGSVLSALLSSACCWLPLLLLAFGTSAAGVAGFLEAWRPWFLGGAVLLLGAGVYFSYFRKQECAPDCSCSVPGSKLRRFHRVMLWVSALLVALFAWFPNYLSVILGIDRSAGSITEMAGIESAIVLRVEGMTCDACAISLENGLSGVPGIAAVKVDYEDGRALVLPVRDAAIDSVRSNAVATIERLGYLVVDLAEPVR